jgi:hypothetical protein
MKLSARAFLLSHVCIDEGCFGQSYDVHVGNHYGRLLTPRLAWTGERVHVEGWNTPDPFSGLATSPHHVPIERDTWGEVFVFHPEARTCAAWISSVILEIEIPGDLISTATNGQGQCATGDAIAEFQQQAHRWLERVRDWVGVVADQHTGDPRLRQGTDIQNRIWVWPTDAGSDYRCNVSHTVAIRHQQTEVMNKTEWQYVLDRASHEDQAPLERSMLANARNALRQGRYREAVLHAATAAELTLKETLSNEMTSVDARLRDRLLKNATLGKIVDLLKHKPLPVGIRDGLVIARNGAIHRGAPVTFAVAQEAVRLAVAVVQQFSALSPPL